ncbi:MAG: energy-coupling factor ABC transporter permease [Planctomycetota bacterium]
MHIPDGFLSTPVCLGAGAISAAAVGVALNVTRRRLTDRQAPLIGVTAAFIFAAMMLNYPIGFGTSGHVLGACLAALLLGPLESCLILSLVLLLQCLLFADGGLTTLGANILNMGVVASFTGYGAHALLGWVLPRRWRESRVGFLARAAVAAWVSVVLAAVCCAGELTLSGTTGAQAGVVFGLIVGVHALIGIGEAFMTVAVLSLLTQARPDLVRAWRPSATPAFEPPAASPTPGSGLLPEAQP